MDDERRPAAFHRLLKLAKEFCSKEFRDTYVASHTRRFLAWQMRKFRGDLSQTEFADLIEKRQTIISRLENPNYSGWTLGTLFEIASKLNVAVFVRFVDFPTFIKYTEEQGENALRPASYDQHQIDDFAQSEADQEAAILRALEPVKPKEDIAKKVAEKAQKYSEERGLFHPEQPERPLIADDRIAQWRGPKRSNPGAGVPL